MCGTMWLTTLTAACRNKLTELWTTLPDSKENQTNVKKARLDLKSAVQSLTLTERTLYPCRVVALLMEKYDCLYKEWEEANNITTLFCHNQEESNTE